MVAEPVDVKPVEVLVVESVSAEESTEMVVVGREASDEMADIMDVVDEAPDMVSVALLLVPDSVVEVVLDKPFGSASDEDDEVVNEGAGVVETDGDEALGVVVLSVLRDGEEESVELAEEVLAELVDVVLATEPEARTVESAVVVLADVAVVVADKLPVVELPEIVSEEDVSAKLAAKLPVELGEAVLDSEAELEIGKLAEGMLIDVLGAVVARKLVEELLEITPKEGEVDTKLVTVEAEEKSEWTVDKVLGLSMLFVSATREVDGVEVDVVVTLTRLSVLVDEVPAVEMEVELTKSVLVLSVLLEMIDDEINDVVENVAAIGLVGMAGVADVNRVLRL